MSSNEEMLLGLVKDKGVEHQEMEKPVEIRVVKERDIKAEQGKVQEEVSREDGVEVQEEEAEKREDGIIIRGINRAGPLGIASRVLCPQGAMSQYILSHPLRTNNPVKIGLASG